MSNLERRTERFHFQFISRFSELKCEQSSCCARFRVVTHTSRVTRRARENEFYFTDVFYIQCEPCYLTVVSLFIAAVEIYLQFPTVISYYLS